MKKLVLLLLFVLCLTCVSAAEYQDYIVSVDYGLDVIDYNPGLYQLNRALHFESTELAGFILEPYVTSDTHVMSEEEFKVADDVWIFTPGVLGLLENGEEMMPQKWGWVYYRDSNDGEVKFFGHVDLISKGNYIFGLSYGEVYDIETIPGPYANILGFDLNNEVQVFWGLQADNAMYDSLGYQFGVVEGNEIVLNYVEDVGLMDEDVVSSNGIIVKNPNLNSLNDQFLFSVPDMKFVYMAPVEEKTVFDMYRAASDEVQSWTWLWVTLFVVGLIVFGLLIGLIYNKVTGKKVSKRKVKKKKSKKKRRKK